MRELGDKTYIDDTFPDEHVLAASQDLIPWFADFANYQASGIVPSDLSFHQRKNLMYDVKKFFGMKHSYVGAVPICLFGVVCQKSRC